MNLVLYFIYFIIYAIIGWVIEVFYIAIRTGNYVNRGFLIGPYCPIYGIGALILLFLLEPYKGNLFSVFLLSIFLFSVLEYFTSYLMEKIFHTRWWDYSYRKYHLNGRISLSTIIPFGFAGLLVLYIVHPFIERHILSINSGFFYFIAFILLIPFSVDLWFTSVTIFKFSRKIFIPGKDMTEELRMRVHQTLYQNSMIYRRIIKAFPILK